MRFDCDKCKNGKITRYMHIDNGFCYKCNGTGKLSYDPTPKGAVIREEWSDRERMEIKEEQEMIEKAERENWMFANNIEEYY
ncbi:hypothetical protein [Bacillus stercoris]|uniref:hypothetical protein n=1 Tax=Bacillus stercoris TaxID=2054641 RepID=UPI003CFB601A